MALRSKNILDYFDYPFPGLPEGVNLPCDIHLYLPHNKHLLLFRKEGTPIDPDFIARYKDKGLKVVWVHLDDRRKFFALVSDEPVAIETDKKAEEREATMTPEEKAEREKAREEHAAEKAAEKKKIKGAYELGETEASREKDKEKEAGGSSDSDSPEKDSEDEASGSAEEKREKKEKAFEMGAADGSTSDSDDDSSGDEKSKKADEYEEEETVVGADGKPEKKKKKIKGAYELGDSEANDSADEDDDSSEDTKDKTGEKKKKKSKGLDGMDASDSSTDSSNDAEDDDSGTQGKKDKKKDPYGRSDDDSASKDKSKDPFNSKDAADKLRAAQERKNKKRMMYSMDEEDIVGPDAADIGRPDLSDPEKEAPEPELPLLTPEEQEAPPPGIVAATILNSAELSEDEKKEVLEQIARDALSDINKPGGLKNAMDMVKDLMEEISEEAETLIAEIWDLQNLDPRLSHGAKVTTFTVLFAMAFGNVNPKVLSDLTMACLLHDSGLCMIPAHLVPMTWKSREDAGAHEYYNHALEALKIISAEYPSFTNRSKLILEQHHERFDGSGHPKQIQGFDLQDLSQLLILADTMEYLRLGLWDGEKRNLKQSIKTLREMQKDPTAPSLVNPDNLERVIQQIENDMLSKNKKKAVDSVKEEGKKLNSGDSDGPSALAGPGER